MKIQKSYRLEDIVVKYINSIPDFIIGSEVGKLELLLECGRKSRGDIGIFTQEEVDLMKRTLDLHISNPHAISDDENKMNPFLTNLHTMLVYGMPAGYTPDEKVRIFDKVVSLSAMGSLSVVMKLATGNIDDLLLPPVSNGCAYKVRFNILEEHSGVRIGEWYYNVKWFSYPKYANFNTLTELNITPNMIIDSSISANMTEFEIDIDPEIAKVANGCSGMFGDRLIESIDVEAGALEEFGATSLKLDQVNGAIYIDIDTSAFIKMWVESGYAKKILSAKTISSHQDYLDVSARNEEDMARTNARNEEKRARRAKVELDIENTTDRFIAEHGTAYLKKLHEDGYEFDIVFGEELMQLISPDVAIYTVSEHAVTHYDIDTPSKRDLELFIKTKDTILAKFKSYDYEIFSPSFELVEIKNSGWTDGISEEDVMMYIPEYRTYIELAPEK